MGIQPYIIAARDDACERVVQSADGVVYTGQSRDAYTSIENILEAAHHLNCEALLPGWGFLSEDTCFAQACRLAGCHFIGPSTRQLQCFGDKLQTIHALEHAFSHKHPAIACCSTQLHQWINDNSGPWMLKNRFGGGGKDIHFIKDRTTLETKLQSLRISETIGRYYLEKACVGPGVRHIEFQFFGDGKGAVALLGARDCTPQIHHQKWLETSIRLSQHPDLLCLGARIQSILQEYRYQSWGTVECLRNANGDFQLLELNPRLQVEHGVTEMASDLDLVKAAIELSCYGQTISFPRDLDRYESVEFRLIASDTGVISRMGFDGHPWPHHPFDNHPDYRIESAFGPGTNITGVYDGVCARFIVRAENARSALSKIKDWLGTFRIEGVSTNLACLQAYDLASC